MREIGTRGPFVDEAKQKGLHEASRPEPALVTIKEAVARFLNSKRNENLADLDKLATIFDKQFLAWTTSFRLRTLLRSRLPISKASVTRGAMVPLPRTKRAVDGDRDRRALGSQRGARSPRGPRFPGRFPHRKQGAGSGPLTDRFEFNLTVVGLRQRHNISGSLASRGAFRQGSLVHDQPVQGELLYDLLELVEIHWLLNIAVDM
jgi:hypothetical protein